MNRENVYIEDNTIIFEPSKNVVANFIFYQGGLVKPESYAVLAQMLSDEGIRVFIPRMPFNLAILNQNAYKDIIQNSSYMEDFYIGGHSLGGATAAIALSKEATPFKGVIFLAGYGTDDSNLRNKDIKVLSITAENDEVFNWERYEAYKDLLPNDSMFYTIGGGNHAGFGFYGEQKGDGIAEITREIQHKITVERIVDFIKEK
nr:alpha/beta hydrolase [Acetoanaerobium pronyense]